MTWVSGAMLGWTIAVVSVAWLMPRRWQAAAVALLSAVFLAYYAPFSTALLALFGATSFFLLEPERVSGWRAAAVAAGIAGFLLWAKLGVDTDLSAELGEPLVPLGLSYYALRAIHYVLERYKGTLPPHTFWQYLCYLFFFPILLAGPISPFPDFQRDLRRRRWDAALFSRGCERILHGYAKIVILGNYLVSIEMAGWIAETYPRGSAAGAYLDCLRFGLNLWAQFSGFSDVAIGIGLLLGFHVMENFRAPFLAPNINEFWRRWHISLTAWCRSYVYLPAVSLTRRPVVGVLLSMIAIGLWHELSLRFLVWGLYHGAGIAVRNAAFRWRPNALAKAPAPLAAASRGLSILLTFNFVICSFALTKEPTLGSALGVYQTMLGLR